MRNIGGASPIRWTAAQIARMVAMADAYSADGKRPHWNKIAGLIGHPSSSCQQMMVRVRAERRDNEACEQLQAVRTAEASKPWRPDQQQTALVRRGPARDPQPTSTFRYVMDAELRARIEGQGVTAGLLGDPVKGRSALDKIHRGEELPPPLMDSDLWRFAPRRVAPWVTLAEEPAR